MKHEITLTLSSSELRKLEFVSSELYCADMQCMSSDPREAFLKYCIKSYAEMLICGQSKSDVEYVALPVPRSLVFENDDTLPFGDGTAATDDLPF